MRNRWAIIVAFGLGGAVAWASPAADPALEALIRQALDANPGIQAMTHRAQAVRAAAQQARAAWWPRLYAATAYTITDNAPQAFMMTLNQRRLDLTDPMLDMNHPEDTGNIRLSLGFRHRILDPARGARASAARFGAEQAAALERAACNALAHEVTRGYYHVLEAQAFVAVQQAAMESLEASLRAARERFESGSAVKTDVLNLEVQVAQADENLIRARNGLQLAVAALNTAVGAEVVTTNGVAAPAMTLEAPSPEAVNPRNRPEWTAQTLAVEQARRQWIAVRRQRVPTLNAFGSVDWDSEDLRDAESSYMAGVICEWEWFSGFEQSGKVSEARAQWQAAEAECARIENALVLECKQAGLAVQEAWARLQVTSRAIGSAEEALRITRAQYQEGAADVATLLVAELGLTETRMRHTAAQYDYQIATSNLDRASGALADRYAPLPVVP